MVQLRAELFESALRLLTGRRIQRQDAVRLRLPAGRRIVARGLEESLRGLARLGTRSAAADCPDRSRQSDSTGNLDMSL